MAKLLWIELLLSGDPITAFLTLVGLGVWAVAFGAGGYITIRATVAAVVSGYEMVSPERELRRSRNGVHGSDHSARDKYEQGACFRRW